MLKAQDNKAAFTNYAQSTFSMESMYPQVYKSWPEERRKAHDAGFAFLTNKLAKLDQLLDSQLKQ